MAYEINFGVRKIVVQENPVINKVTNVIDVTANQAVPVTEDLDIQQIADITFPGGA